MATAIEVANFIKKFKINCFSKGGKLRKIN